MVIRIYLGLKFQVGIALLTLLIKIVLDFFKGQLISKCLFVDFNFFQKTNKNTLQSSKNEFIRSFFGRIHGLTICFRN